jgi:superfamily II DNA or RNA helicase
MSPDASYFANSTEFQLFTSSTSPAWRRPQLGALGALLKHWSLPDPEPALISLPTGTGKTAVAIAAAHVAQAQRVLVVVPSTELRRQLAQAFESQDVLKRIGALPDSAASPHVMIVQGLVEDWSTLEDADVVVALPNSISPVHYESNPPPRDLFELLVIDEAHHAPARTWRAILDHFECNRAVLLTATPRRRDGQQLPGHHAYHYPLRQALEDDVYKTVEPRLLDVNGSTDKAAVDGIILAEAQRQLNLEEHASSTLLIRAASRERATQLSKRYTESGVPTRVLHSGLGKSAQQTIVNELRAGQLRAVAVVGMLIEGFDLPSLRIVAYHDKHKSLLATAQLIGRLARVDSEFPQPSLLITARDVDVSPNCEV